MMREAVASGDQPFGAVVVKDSTIIGCGPSRAIVDDNANAQAEHVALWDAQRRLGIIELTPVISIRLPGRVSHLRMSLPPRIASVCIWSRRRRCGKAAAFALGVP